MCSVIRFHARVDMSYLICSRVLLCRSARVHSTCQEIVLIALARTASVVFGVDASTDADNSRLCKRHECRMLLSSFSLLSGRRLAPIPVFDFFFRSSS